MPIRIKLSGQMAGANGYHAPGAEVDFPDAVAKQLIKGRHGIEVVDAPDPDAEADLFDETEGPEPATGFGPDGVLEALGPGTKRKRKQP